MCSRIKALCRDCDWWLSVSAERQMTRMAEDRPVTQGDITVL
jgi:hypothetical protein